MAKQVQSWQANDGSLHSSECDAATQDVNLMVAASPLAENSPFALKLVEWLCDKAPLIRATLEAHERACPRAEERDETPSSYSPVDALTPMLNHRSYCQLLGPEDLECDCGYESSRNVT